MPEESRLSLKWIDGNDVVTLSGGTYTEPVDVHINGNTEGIPTFNVDNPTMWTPLSVMSGLASGFCERRAVLDSEFKTGASTSKTWLQNDDTSAAIADRAAIVSNCMHNLALGSDYAHLFYSSGANATMVPIGSAAVSNYMTAMDSAITAVVSGTNVYVDENGSSYESTGRTAFNGLASSAYMTASTQAEAGSSILRPSSGGGSSLKTTMAIGLPVEWAKERKWMLDELKYTAGTAMPYLNTPNDRAMYMLEGRNDVSASTLSGALSAYVDTASSVVDVRSQTINGNYPSYTNLRLTRIVSGGTSFVVSGQSPIAYGMLAKWLGGTATQTPLDIYIAAPILQDTDPGLWFIPNYYNSATSSWYNIPNYYSGTSTIDISNTSRYARRYVVGSGASITFTAPTVISSADAAEIGILDIKAGGVVRVDPGSTGAFKVTSISYCNVESGGKLLFIENGSAVTTRDSGTVYKSPIYINLYTNYRTVADFYGGGYGDGEYVYLEGGSLTRLPISSGGTNPYGMYVLGADHGANSVRISIPNSQAELMQAVVESGCTAIVSGSVTRLGAFGIMPGAVFNFTEGSMLGGLRIASGATATVAAWCQGVYVASGGKLYVTGSGHISDLEVEDGAEVYLTGNAVSDGNIINAANDTLVGAVTVRLFNPLPVSGISAGWNTSKTVTAQTSEDVLFAGSALATTTAARAAVSASIKSAAASLKDITDPIYSGYGSSTVGNVTYKGYGVFGPLSSCDVVYGAKALAMYPAGSSTSVNSHYSEFYVRQFPTQAEIDQATSSATTT